MKNLYKNLSLNFEFIIRCFIIGSTVFGGLAMISYLKDEFASKKGYVTENDFLKGIALTQLLPGPIMINLVGYVGYRRFGFLSGLIGALALVFPSTILISIIAYFYKSINVATIDTLFHGLKPFVVAFFYFCLFKFLQKVYKYKFWKDIIVVVLHRIYARYKYLFSFFDFFFSFYIF